MSEETAAAEDQQPPAQERHPILALHDELQTALETIRSGHTFDPVADLEQIKAEILQWEGALFAHLHAAQQRLAGIIEEARSKV